MQKYQDVATIIGPPGLIPVRGVNVAVYNHGTQNTTAIYSDNSSTVTANPLTTDASGLYSFYAGNGRYDITVSGVGVQTTTLTDIFLYDPSEDYVSITATGAVCDWNGVTGTDDTVAVQRAVSTGKSVYFPGIARTTSTISFNTIGQRFYGASMELGGIHVDAAVHGFKYSGAGLIRSTFNDLSITGSTTSLNAIDFSNATNVYESDFSNLVLYTGGKAIYAPTGEFSNTYRNIQHSSYNDNGIEIVGGPSVSLIGCYGHTFSAGKYPYRIYGGATLIACNGVDNADYWGLFGRNVALDGVNSIFRVTLIGCNIEDCKVQGLRFRFTGSAVIVNANFQPPAAATSPTYDCSIYVEFTDQLITLISPVFTPKGGSVRQKLAEIFYLAGSGLIIHSNTGPTSFDVNGTLVNAPNFGSATINSLNQGVSLNGLVISGHKITSSTIGFYGTNPVAQQNVSTVVASTGATSNTPFGFATSSQANDLTARVALLQQTLKNYGLSA